MWKWIRLRLLLIMYCYLIDHCRHHQRNDGHSYRSRSCPTNRRQLYNSLLIHNKSSDNLPNRLLCMRGLLRWRVLPDWAELRYYLLPGYVFYHYH